MFCYLATGNAEQIPPYEINSAGGANAVSMSYQSSRFSPMASVSSTPISEDAIYSYNSEMARRVGNSHSALTHSSTHPRENPYHNFYASGYPVSSSLPGRGATHPTTPLNPYQLSIPSYPGSQSAVSNGILHSHDHPEVTNLSHTGTYPGSASEGWNGHPSHSYTGIEYSRLPMTLPGSIAYPYQGMVSILHYIILHCLYATTQLHVVTVTCEASIQSTHV